MYKSTTRHEWLCCRALLAQVIIIIILALEI